MDQSYYDQFNVTNWLPTKEQLIEQFNERKGKGSKTRFINEALKEALETREDLFKALETRDNGMLHGARHTFLDLKVYDNYIKNIRYLKIYHHETI
jgi:phage regulator Rha-like protein